MNDDSNILDDRSALMLYLADELPMGLAHEIDTRLAREPELSCMLEELRKLELDVHLMMEVSAGDLRAGAITRGTMAAIRKRAMAPEEGGERVLGENYPHERRRRRIGVLGYGAFAVAACLVLALGLWTLGLFGFGSSNDKKASEFQQNAVVNLDENFLTPSDALTPRLNEASEHLRALRENQSDDNWLMMM